MSASIVEEELRRYMMVQGEIPQLLGENKRYVVVAIGDLDAGMNQLKKIAQELQLPIERQR